MKGMSTDTLPVTVVLTAHVMHTK